MPPAEQEMTGPLEDRLLISCAPPYALASRAALLLLRQGDLLLARPREPPAALGNHRPVVVLPSSSGGMSTPFARDEGGSASGLGNR